MIENRSSTKNLQNSLEIINLILKALNRRRKWIFLFSIFIFDTFMVQNTGKWPHLKSNCISYFVHSCHRSVFSNCLLVRWYDFEVFHRLFAAVHRTGFWNDQVVLKYLAFYESVSAWIRLLKKVTQTPSDIFFNFSWKFTVW